MTDKRYIISGMSCAACSASVQRVVSRLDGVENCEVNLMTGKMTVSFDPLKTGEHDFIMVVEKAGFGISPDIEEKPKTTEKARKDSIIPFIISAVCSALLLYISMGQMLFDNLPLPEFINMNNAPFNFALTQLLLCIPVLFFGRKFFTSGIPLILKGHPNMDSLVAVGTSASLIYSIVMTYMIGYDHHAVHNLYYESVAVVITLVALGKFMEQKSKCKTADAIKKLMELSPDTAVVIRNENEIIVPIDSVAVGETVVIKAGAKIPLDGVVLSGGGSADEAMLTGESMPVQKEVGSTVIGGSIALNGYMTVKVTKIGNDTALTKIIRFVEDAQNKKAPISAVADKVAGVFVPIVILIALLSAIIWLIAGKDIAFALKIFTAVLVIACPCALGLATPTAIMVGTGLGAANGILIRNGEILEITHKVKATVFDKTGTVTVGKAVVTDILGQDKEKLIGITAAVETASNHPLALAILDYAKQNNISYGGNIQNLKNISGKGIVCSFNESEVLVGSALLLEEYGIDVGVFSNEAAELSGMGKSIVFTAMDKSLLGLFAVADEVKETSKPAFERLQKMGVKTILLSGDNKACAEYIAAKVGADEVYSEVLPEQKALIVSEIRKKYGTVMMVGDGINDAPALTEADIGCAIGNGSDIAIETADIVLMKSDLADVPRAIKLSRLTITDIKQNLFWAFCYNTVCIPVAAGVLYAFGGPLLNPMLAGLAMSLSSCFVVGNALRLRGKKL